MHALPSQLRGLLPRVHESLLLMRAWFKHMTSPGTHRLAYMYHPDKQAHAWQTTAVRDLGSAYDIGLVQSYLESTEFSQVRGD
jgi:hypothetical protein